MTAKAAGTMRRAAGGLMRRARHLEWRVADAVQRASRHLTQADGRGPLEVAHAIVDRVESHAHVAGRGRRTFTATDVRVTVRAPTREMRERYAAVFDGPATLRDRIVERLDAIGCGVEDLTVTVTYAPQARPGWETPDFHVALQRRDASAAAVAIDDASAAAVVELRVTRGTTEQPSYCCSQARVDIGRCREVRDTQQRLVRTNHVVFVDCDEPVNQRVSRQHAHIANERPGDVRIHDDGSAHGTAIVRSGRTIPVPPGSLGVRLRTGDEILLGEARLEVGLRRGGGRSEAEPR